MTKQFNYKSVLAPYIQRLIDIKVSSGCVCLHLKWILKEFDDFAALTGLQDPHISEDFIKCWRQSRKNDSDRTIYKKFSAWNMLTSMMNRNGVSCFIPRRPRHVKSDFAPYIFTEQQMASIFRAVDELRLYDMRMGTAIIAMPAIFRLPYSTGLRVSEALSLKNSDINLHDGYITVRKTKNGSGRVVALSDSMAEVMAAYLEARDRMPLAAVSDSDKPVFIKTDGTTMSSETVYSNFRRILDKCGIAHGGRKVGPCVHSLRHTSACHALGQMAKSGMDIYAALPIISASLGHHSLSATEQYVRLTQAMFPEISEQCSKINAFVHPKICPSYDYSD